MQIVLYVKDLVKLQVCNTLILFPTIHNNYREVQTQNNVKYFFNHMGESLQD